MTSATSWSRIPGVVLFACALILPSSAPAQEPHTGDLLGDLVHIKRDATTGQPVLQKRWVSLPNDTFGWDYCPIPVDIDGSEIPFAELACDVDPTQLDRVVEVDYFGRLSGGRTKERNQRMHFDEVISNMKLAERIDVDDSGRLRLGTSCDPAADCASWKTIDSPMENLALYNRLLKYGHLQTDPLEVDADAEGDPSAGTVYHPALAEADWAKFRRHTVALLPRATASMCFNGDALLPACAVPQALAPADFILVATFLGGAADKTGRVTPDLVQYLNRILKVPVATTSTLAPVNTLPALIRDENGVIAPATPGLPFPASERFVDWSAASYSRTDWFDRSTLVLQTADAGMTWQPTVVQLLQWLSYVNGPPPGVRTVMPGFVTTANDTLRVIEFVHEYAIPANLWGSGVATHTGPHGATVRHRATPQEVPFTATVLATNPVNAGTVTFSVKTAAGAPIGVPVTSAAVAGGVAAATFTLPGGTDVQSLVVIAVYNGADGLLPSSGSSSLVVGLADTTTRAEATTAAQSQTDRTVPLTARIAWADTEPVSEGTVEFTVRNAAGALVGTPTTAVVSGGAAVAAYPIPGGTAAQRLTTTAVFSGTARFAASSGRNTLSIGCLPVTMKPFTLPRAMVGAAYAVAIETDGIEPVTVSVDGALPQGLTLTAALLSGSPTANGTFEVTVTATDAAGCAGSASYTLHVDPSLSVIAVAPGAGMPGVVRHFEPNGTQTSGGEYAPYTWAWTGGVRLARADFTRDGVPDTVVAPGPGMAPMVSIFNGASQALILSLPVFEPSYTGGVELAAGDVTGDGVPELVAAASTGAPRVRVFNGATGALLLDFAAFSTAGMNGVHVALGDVTGDGRADLIAGSGAGAEPTVRVFDGATGAVVHEFLAYPAVFRGGVFVAAGDLNADGRADVITGPDTGGGPLVRAFNGATAAQMREFWAYDQAFLGGVRVTAEDVTGDGHAEILTAPGPGGAPTVKVFHGVTNATLWAFPVYPPEVTTGVYLAAPVRVVR